MCSWALQCRGLVSSLKWFTSEYLIARYKSFMWWRDKKGPTMEPSESPDLISAKLAFSHLMKQSAFCYWDKK